MPIDSFYDQGLLMRGFRSEHEAIAYSLLRKTRNGTDVVGLRETAGKDGNLVRQAFKELVTSSILSETVIDESQPLSLSNCNYKVNAAQRKAVTTSFNEKKKKLRHPS
ncbi:MAG: hypothetical protein Q8R15_00270 [Candidatus Micrarchaeota archaeon]|nr:hypothetical protein [Candidatus Micrarchaeota archaeon]